VQAVLILRLISRFLIPSTAKLTQPHDSAHGKCTSDAGIVPYINASIILQLLSTAFPGLKKMQREGGPQVDLARHLLETAL